MRIVKTSTPHRHHHQNDKTKDRNGFTSAEEANRTIQFDSMAQANNCQIPENKQ